MWKNLHYGMLVIIALGFVVLYKEIGQYILQTLFCLFCLCRRLADKKTREWYLEV